MRKLVLLLTLTAIFACNSNHMMSEDNAKKTDADTSTSTSTTSSNASNSEADRIERLGQSVDMKVFDKGFSKIEGKDMTRFDISITNKSDQVITAVKGRFVVDDAFGDHLKNYNLKFDDTDIKPGKTLKITRFWAYDKNESGDAKIKSTSLRKLKIDYEPQMVLFADGSSLQ